ncbi:LysM peptidoglycan-binding domain-containing protein [Pontibacter sp. CAU 1760]
MRKSFSSLLVLLLLPLLALAQFVTVPRNVYFADLHLTLSSGAQEEIQKKVDALHRNQTYFKLKVDLADAYFPIIERVFKEEGVPDDYKYLALQESGLIGDAVSTSNAVGYWQFKREAASDFNLRMDNKVDERRHIIEASRGAAKYFLRSNKYYNNWLNSLLSYYQGYSGAKPYTQPADNGARKMDITERSHPYILTFLAHKVAYDTFVGKSNPPALSLREMRGTPGQSLADIAMSTKTDYIELEKYNKWLLGGSIPSDKDYYVMVPVRNGSDAGLLASKDTTPAAARRGLSSIIRLEQNSLSTITAQPGETKEQLARKANLPTRKFLRYNDMQSFDNIVAGQTYYTEPKRFNADVEYHVVQHGETMQQISQRYGIRLSYLLFKNRMSRSEVPSPGRVLWLQHRRPSSVPVEVRDLKQQKTVAVASHNTPTQEKRPATVAKATAVSHQDAPAKKDNIFRRFIDSFKRFKKDKPEEQEEENWIKPATASAEAAPAPATDEDGFIDPMTTDTAEAVTAEAKQKDQAASQPKKVILYPTTKPEATAAKTTPAAQPQPTEQQSKTEKATFPASTPMATPAPEEDWNNSADDQDDTATDEVMDVFVEPASKPAPKAKPVAAPAKQTSTAATPAPTKHTVRQGETLYSISRMYAVTINDITNWNNMGDSPLKIGQELYIAEPLTEPATAASATKSAAVSSPYHTVTTGETLYQISKRYGVTPGQLQNWNNLADNSIRLGQELRVQAPTSRAAESVETNATTEVSNAPANGYHTVASGESMYQISRKYGVTIKDIMEWNNKSDFSVSIGEKLQIKKK